MGPPPAGATGHGLDSHPLLIGVTTAFDVSVFDSRYYDE